MNERSTLVYKNISLILFSKRGPQFVVSWEKDGETYAQRGDFFLSHFFNREPGGANACTPLQVMSAETPLLGCMSLARLLILCTLSKSYHMVLMTWSPSGYTPVGPDCHDMLSPPCLLITTWQLVKAHRVTRNKPKYPCHMLYNRNVFDN